MFSVLILTPKIHDINSFIVCFTNKLRFLDVDKSSFLSFNFQLLIDVGQEKFHVPFAFEDPFVS